MPEGASVFVVYTNVPLIIKLTKKEGKKINKKVSLIDLAPTLCRLINIDPPPSFKGKNLFESPTFPIFHQVAPNITDNQVNQNQLLKELNQYKIAYQSEEWKYIFDNLTSSEELYYLSEDPKEKNNLANQETKIIYRMREKIKEFEKENPPLSLLKNYGRK